MLELSKLKVDAKVDTAVANFGGAMEADTISKHGRSSKSQMSRGNFLRTTYVLASVLVMATSIACGGGSGGKNSAITLEEFKKRYKEISEDQNYFDSRYDYAPYAASNKSLEEFKKRYKEISEDQNYFDSRYDYALYAAN